MTVLRSYLYEAAGVLMTRVRRSMSAKDVGATACQTHRLEARVHCRGTQARHHPACHLAQRHRVRVADSQHGASLISHDRASARAEGVPAGTTGRLTS